MTIFRNRRRSIVVRSGGVLAALVVWGLSPAGGPVPLALAAALLLPTVYALRRPRLSVTEHGLTVANFLTTRRIRWAQVDGFGYGEHRNAWCVEVRRTDGGVVPVRVLSDDQAVGGYSSERISRVVADLRLRLEAATGARDSGKAIDLDDGTTLDLDSLAGGDFSTRRIRRQNRWQFPLAIALGVFFVGLGASLVVGAAKRPQTYATLRQSGVRLDARFDGCGPIDRFDRTRGDAVCRLTVTYLGRTRRWNYQDDYPQFDHVRVGGQVPVLLDAAHPTTVYTVHDVTANTNSGVLSAIGFLGIGLVVVGAAFVVFVLRIWHRVRRILEEADDDLDPEYRAAPL